MDMAPQQKVGGKCGLVSLILVSFGDDLKQSFYQERPYDRGIREDFGVPATFALGNKFPP